MITKEQLFAVFPSLESMTTEQVLLMHFLVNTFGFELVFQALGEICVELCDTCDHVDTCTNRRYIIGQKVLDAEPTEEP